MIQINKQTNKKKNNNNNERPHLMISFQPKCQSAQVPTKLMKCQHCWCVEALKKLTQINEIRNEKDVKINSQYF